MLVGVTWYEYSKRKHGKFVKSWIKFLTEQQTYHLMLFKNVIIHTSTNAAQLPPPPIA